MSSPAPKSLSVSQLTHYLRQKLEQDPALLDVWVTGEISNLTAHGSGHVYFTLKDEQAQIACAMFRAVAAQITGPLPKHGDQVLLRGNLTVYPPSGRYQLIVKEMRRSGQGDLHQRFLDLKARLEAEGLFDPALKRPLPRFPQRIGIVTSPTGAVIRDVVQTLRRRWPVVELILAPAVVQGEQGAPSIVRSLTKLAAFQPELILLVRGGGSLEDLWCFNEEAVARAIRACPVPVISGVGHETDFTIADFAADKRASTPTAAAEMATPVMDELRAGLQQAQQQLKRMLQHYVDFRRQVLDDYEGRMLLLLRNRLDRVRGELMQMETALHTQVERSLRQTRSELVTLETALNTQVYRSITQTRADLDLYETRLKALDLRAVLERGFSLTVHDGKPVLDAASLQAGDPLTTYFAQGKTRSTVDENPEL